MSSCTPFNVLRIALLGILLWGWLPAPEVQAQKPVSTRQQSELTPQQAAAKARDAHGGKVLKVTRKGKGYRVRLLLDSGRVTTVFVEG